MGESEWVLPSVGLGSDFHELTGRPRARIFTSISLCFLIWKVGVKTSCLMMYRLREIIPIEVNNTNRPGEREASRGGGLLHVTPEATQDQAWRLPQRPPTRSPRPTWRLPSSQFRVSLLSANSLSGQEVTVRETLTRQHPQRKL